MNRKLKTASELRQENLIRVINELGGPDGKGGAADLARLLGYSNASSISQLRKGRGMGDEVARRIEAATKKPHGWMDVDHSQDEITTTDGVKIAIRSVPELRQWAQASTYSPDRGDAAINAERWVPTTADVSDRAFALRVEGDSMVGPGTMSYPPGCTIIVDPALQWRSGDRVIVDLGNGEAEPAFKMIVKDAGRTYLRALNPSYPTIELTSIMKVIGVVVQTLIDEVQRR